MIAINLLPEAYRKPVSTPLQQFPRTPLALLVGGVVIGGTCLLYAGQLFQQHRLNRFRARIHQLDVDRREADQIQHTVQTLQQQQATYQQLDRERSRWARRLSALAQLTPDGVWFTDLSVEPLKGLSLKGAALIQGGEEMARIGQLVQDLKQHPEWADLAKDVQLEAIRRVQDGDVEIVAFSVLDAPGQAPAKSAR